MANIYKKVNTDLITNTQKDVYTVPGNSRALVKSIHVYNEGAGDAVVTNLQCQPSCKSAAGSNVTACVPPLTINVLPESLCFIT